MSLATIFTTLKTDYIKYAPAIALIAVGAAEIAAKNYGPGAQSVLQGLALIFGGAAVMALHQEVHAMPDRVLMKAEKYETEYRERETHPVRPSSPQVVDIAPPKYMDPTK